MKLFCSLCDKEIPVGNDYFDVILLVKEWDGEEIQDAKEQESNDFCEDCVEQKNISVILYNILNKRCPNPDRNPKKKGKK